MEFIKPGTTLDFMKYARWFMAGSGLLVLVSLVLIFTLGFDSGIDFKGGTKIIMEFKADSNVDRNEIRSVVNALVEKQKGVKGTQVEVQDFDVGLGATADTVKFQVFTELSSLLSPTRKLEMGRKLEEHFGKGTVVESPFEAGDKFYVYLLDDWTRADATTELAGVFAREGHANVTVRSDKEERIYSDMLREKDLLLSSGNEDMQAEAAKVEAEATARIAKISDSRFIVEVQSIKDEVTAAMKKDFGDKFVDVISTASVSPSVGRELFNTAMLALLYAVIGILVYVAIRFDMKFAPGAILCIVHDIILVMGVMIVTQVKFTLPIVAALLTIIGYDINDTIVIYDRIRENIGKGRGGDLRAQMNLALNETLSRTIITSGVTLLSVISILLLGGGTTADFAFLLFVGMIFGSYSTIFIASPITLYIDKYMKRRKLAARA